ncbi:MAG: polyprenyl synthetase family protein [Chloroflexota bacterium]|nr:polyprenyl synthetase family protein [Chloroflexota bacterium]
MELPEVFNRYRAEVEKELASNINGGDLALYDMMRYHMGWIDEEGRTQDAGGKLVRPTLLLLACESVGEDWRTALPAAAAVELVHNFSLIHDDIEDGDKERRQRATVWRLWGEPQAINVGDAMHSMARLALASLDEKYAPPAKMLRAARILDKTCLDLCEGQYLDIDYESRFDINIDDYLTMIDLKTASLITCSVQLGALIGTNDEQMVERLRRFGRKLGIAYQMTDDVLGIWGEKPISDIHKKKKTLPVIYALKHADEKERSELEAIYSQESISQREVHQVIDILNRLNAEEYARDMAQKYYAEALAEIDTERIPQPKRRELREVTDFLMARDY